MVKQAFFYAIIWNHPIYVSIKLCIPLHSDSDSLTLWVNRTECRNKNCSPGDSMWPFWDGEFRWHPLNRLKTLTSNELGDQVKRVTWIDITWALFLLSEKKNMLQPRKTEYPTWCFFQQAKAPEKLQQKGAQKEPPDRQLRGCCSTWRVDGSMIRVSTLAMKPGSPCHQPLFEKKTYNGTYELTYIMYIYMQ